MTPPPRSRQQRMRDALRRLEDDVDAWVATAAVDGAAPHLTPLSFLWDGSTLLIATAASTATSRNLQATGKLRLGIGETRDVVLIEGAARASSIDEISDEVGDAFAAKAGFDPRSLDSPYLYFQIRPQRVQAWREENELADRELMRGGRWVGDDSGPDGAAPGRIDDATRSRQRPDEQAGGEPTYRSDGPAAGEPTSPSDGPAAAEPTSPSDGPASAEPTYPMQPVGWVESPLTDPAAAPKQADEGAPPARIVFRSEMRKAAADLCAGEEALVLTWLHQARRDALSVHPRGDASRPRQGVFSTRSPDRPNPIGLHRVTIVGVEEGAIAVSRLEAIDGTPVLDIKPVLGPAGER